MVPAGGGVGAAGRGAADPTPAAGNASVRPARSSATVATTGAAASVVLSAAASCSCARTVAMLARSCGSLRSRPPTASASGPPTDIGGTGSEMTAVSVPSALSDSNGGRPSAAAKRVTPSDHRSLSGPNAFPRARSGDM